MTATNLCEIYHVVAYLSTIFIRRRILDPTPSAATRVRRLTSTIHGCPTTRHLPQNPQCLYQTTRPTYRPIEINQKKHLPGYVVVAPFLEGSLVNSKLKYVQQLNYALSDFGSILCRVPKRCLLRPLVKKYRLSTVQVPLLFHVQSFVSASRVKSTRDRYP